MRREKQQSFLSSLGPGLVTGAADDDPSGIGTYSQIGAQFGYRMAWTMPFCFPLMVAIQEVCAWVAAVTGRGIAQNLRRHYPPLILRGAIVLLIAANIFNLGADLGAMGEVVASMLPGPFLLYTALFGIISVVLEIWISYARYARFLKWTTLSLFAYVAVALVIHVPWDEATRGMFIPSFSFGSAESTALVAVLGTTISPYLFFWQAGQEVEEQRHNHDRPLIENPKAVASERRRIRSDTLIGMIFSQIVALAIIIATAATLNASGETSIQSAGQAAEALRPVAGDFAFGLFALGIIGTGMLAVPVLAGSAAYAVCETFKWREGLERRPAEAKAFYTVIAVAGIGGVGFNTFGLDPMKALYWSAVLNGMLAPPLMLLVMLMAINPRIMGRLTISPLLATVGWMSTAVMGLVALVFLVG
jgi:NRAMP (natural resistance-associated macrophage protein)-like metal ion transporter